MMIELWQGETADVELTVGADLSVSGLTIKLHLEDEYSGITKEVPIAEVSDAAEGKVTFRSDPAWRSSTYNLQVELLVGATKRYTDPLPMIIRARG